MTDQTIPADKVREVRDLHRDAANMVTITDAEREIHQHVADAMDALLPAPTRPTLADMALDEQAECAGMQADLVQGDRVVILDGTPDHDGFVQVLERSLDVYSPHPDDVTPRPDLPRLEWPSTEKAAPALPGDWRLANHPDHGRVIVTTQTPNINGYVYVVIPDAGNIMGYDWHFCDPDRLTYIDQ